MSAVANRIESPIPEGAPLADIQAERSRRHLREFVKNAWHVVEPTTTFMPNWHIDAICEHLESLARGEIRNLLINMPPRMMKSLTVSVFFPAWSWIDHPSLRFLYSSYSQELATDHSVASRRVIESDWYQSHWGDRFQLSGDQNLKTKFENDRRGARHSTSVGGTGTGKGGDIIVTDDPHNVKEAGSDTIREATILWWDQVMSTRLNDPKAGARIIVMQRVHESDLSGHVLAQGGYEHLCLPMEYVPTVQVTGIGWSDPRTEEGELLAPDRFGDRELIDAKLRLGSIGYAGQMQQTPSPADGGLFKDWWWQRYTTPPKLTTLDLVLDSAFKDGVGNDYSVFALWGSDGRGSSYLLNLWRQKVQYPDLMRLAHTAHAWATATFPGLHVPLVIEDKASGQSAIQTLKRPMATLDGPTLPALPIVPFPVKSTESKQSRAEGVTPMIEGGRVFIPEHASWLADWIDEHQKFPNGAHDDMVDTTVMALARANRSRGGLA